jgi:hypothetical protein
VTLAPGSTAPEESDTVPTILPSPWANEIVLRSKTTKQTATRCFFIVSLLGRGKRQKRAPRVVRAKLLLKIRTQLDRFAARASLKVSGIMLGDDWLCQDQILKTICLAKLNRCIDSAG